MSKQDKDILQIRKYLDGELDASAMHELERRALNDPFLADALEGYGQATGGQQGNLAELSARIQQRTEPKVKRMIPWGPISIAASIIIAIGVGAWFFMGKRPDKLALVAAAIKTDTQQKQPTISAPATAQYAPKADDKNNNALAVPVEKNLSPVFDKRSKQAEGITDEKQPVSTYSDKANQANDVTVAPPLAANVAPQANNIQTDYLKNSPDTTRALNEVAVMKEVQVKNKADLAYKSTKIPSAAPETELTGKVPGVGYTTTLGKPLSGMVVSTFDGRPITGAVVRVAGTKFGSVTDANGHFVLPDVPEKTTITAGYLGYSTKKIRPGDKDSLKIALEPLVGSAGNNAGFVSADKNVVNPFANAHPSAGWKALTDYLDKNAVSPDGQTGAVQLSFMVDGQGSLSKFKILKSLSPAADQKAIDLINKGPAWAGNIDGQPHEVKLTVTFK